MNVYATINYGNDAEVDVTYNNVQSLDLLAADIRKAFENVTSMVFVIHGLSPKPEETGQIWDKNYGAAGC